MTSNEFIDQEYGTEEKFGSVGATEENHERDVFGSEEGHDRDLTSEYGKFWFDQFCITLKIKYKTLSWQLVAVLMIAEIVSNGMLTLPYALANVGMIPGLVVIVFLGVFATYTSWLLIQFKLRHPEVHTMGDAGYILFGPIGREILAFGTVVFAVFATGSQLFAGQVALGVLSENKLCLMLYTGIFAAAILVCSFPRTLDKLGWLSVPSVICILVAGILGLIASGLYPTPDRTWELAQSNSFYNAFTAVSNPVFAYAGHFMFFILISEMHTPRDAMKAAWTLQIFATTFYAVFAAVCYYYLGDGVQSLSLLSIPTLWSKISFGIAIPNFLIAGSLYSHTASKLVFVRFFRKSRHLHTNTFVGWGVWTLLIILMNGAAFVLAVGVPIFGYLVGLCASLFAAWYTYGIAGAFYLHDSYHDHGGVAAWKNKWFQATLAALTFVAGAVICIAGSYVNIKGIVDAYHDGQVGSPFAC